MNLRSLIGKALPCFIACGVIVALSGCSGAGKGGKEEGVIEFTTRAVDASHPLYGFAPDAATMRYKKDRFVIEMSTMGLFNYSIIADNKERTLAQTVKFMNVKQACIERGREIELDNLDYALSIEETDETKEIIGLKCYKLKVSRVSDPSVKFDAWYTRELGLENCNALTPYAKVKGVLLDYRIKKMGLEMHFLAKSHQEAKVPEHTFKIPATMKIISKQEMEQFFRELQ